MFRAAAWLDTVLIGYPKPDRRRRCFAWRNGTAREVVPTDHALWSDVNSFDSLNAAIIDPILIYDQPLGF